MGRVWRHATVALLVGCLGCAAGTDDPPVAAQARAMRRPARVRDLRLAMSDLYFTFLPPAEAEVDLAAAMGMDDLWIAFLHETGGDDRVVQQLRRAQAAGDFDVFYGLGAPPVAFNPEIPYVDPYVDVSATYSPRAAPLGDFFGATTGRDDPVEDVRTAVLGRDPPGFLDAEVYWRGGVATNFLPGGVEEPRSYRFRFRFRAFDDLAALPPQKAVAVIRIETEDQTQVPPPTLQRLALRVVRAGDLAANGWRPIDVFVDRFVDVPGEVEIKVEWLAAASLALGRIDHQQWDPVAGRPMTTSIARGIVRTEPRDRFGRNVFDYLRGLHGAIAGADRTLFDHLGGFWMLDEPAAPWRDAWNLVAGQVERTLDALPGFRGLRVYTTHQVAVTDPASRFFKLLNLGGYLGFRTPIYRFQNYLFPPGILAQTPTRDGPIYQAHIDERIANWRVTGEGAHGQGQPVQMFIDARTDNLPLTDGEVALQAYLALALGFDSIAIWQIGFAVDWSGPALNARGAFLRDLAADVHAVKPVYDRLQFVDTYSSADLAGRVVTDVTDLSGRHPADLRVQFGEFVLDQRTYLWIVNRHTTDADHLELKVSLDVPDAETWWVVDAADGRILGEVTAASPSFDLPIGPGRGRLVGLRRAEVDDLVGDRDDFHPGDPVDVPFRSRRVRELVAFIASDPGQNPGVDLDVGGADRPVGLTHRLQVPAGATVAAARLRLRFRGAGLSYNDEIFFDGSRSPSEKDPACRKDPARCKRLPILPFIALRDLVGEEPVPGRTYEVTLDLSHVPVRTVDSTGGVPGGHLSPDPDEYRDLRPLVADRLFDLVFADDTTLDWSELSADFDLP
jgi:hypothetical protein